MSNDQSPDVVEGEAQDQVLPEAESSKISRRITTPAKASSSVRLDALRRDLEGVAASVQSIRDEVGPVLGELETAVQETARTVSRTSNAVAEQAGTITAFSKYLDDHRKIMSRLNEKVEWLSEASKIQANSITDLETKAPAGPMVFEAVHRLMQRVEAIGKDGTYNGGQSGRYRFRRVDDVMDAVGHAMRDVGLVMQTQVVSGPSYVTAQVPNRDDRLVEWTTCRVTMAYTFIDVRDGSRHTIEMAGEGRDSSDKATSKAMAMAMKYALTQGLCIPLESEQDPDQERPTIEREASAQRPPQQAQAPAAKQPQPAPEAPQAPAPDTRPPEELARAAIRALRAPDLTEQKFHGIVDYIWSPQNQAVGLANVIADGQRVGDVVIATAATMGLEQSGFTATSGRGS